MKKKTLNEKKSQSTKLITHSSGITLVALIITIIVLLILAVVAIRAVTGDGIIAYAKNARGEYNQAQIEENGVLADYLTKIEENIPGGSGASNVDHTTADGVPIPKGFYVVGGTKDAGLVISDKEGDDLANSKKGNQFVWVPTTADIAPYGLNTSSRREPDVVTGVTPSSTVDSASGSEYDAVESNLTRAGCTENLVDKEGEVAGTINAYDFKAQLTAEFNEMAESVNKYHGFYVGRYEMSYDGTAKSVKGATSLGNYTNYTAENDWYGLYAKAKTYAPENSSKSVVSNMIYGSQYDAMMTWMGAAANNTIGDNRNKNRTTGTCETDIIKNIYDLYGNSCEWTQEADNANSRVVRGGGYADDLSPSFRGDDGPTGTGSSGFIGSRLALYIQ